MRTYKHTDLKDKKIGRLTVVERVGVDRYRHVLWKCTCSCGGEKVVIASNLIREFTTSCGCLMLETRGKAGKTHGMSKTKIYSVWRAMIQRCYNNGQERCRNYGGRGIKVCDRWKESFDNFYKDMGDDYKEGLSIDRINVNGNYELSNCRWATAEQQSNNKTTSKSITIGSDTKSIEGWERSSGTNKRTIRTRLQRGWNPVQAVYGLPVSNLLDISQYLCF